jgi:hypothetical protein
MTKSKRKSGKRNPHWGSTLDDFLEEEGTRETFQAVAIKEVLAWQIEQAMKTQGTVAQASCSGDGNQP